MFGADYFQSTLANLTDDKFRGFTLFWLFPVSLLVGLVSIQNISLFWPSLVSFQWLLISPSLMPFLESLSGPTCMGGGSYSVIPPNPSCGASRPPYTPYPSPDRQESTHDNDTFSSSRQNHDTLL